MNVESIQDYGLIYKLTGPVCIVQFTSIAYFKHATLT